MLLEMGVRVWLPGTDFAVVDSSALPGAAPVKAPNPQDVLRTTPKAQAPQAGVPAHRPVAASPVAPAVAQGRKAGIDSRSGATARNAPAVQRGDGANDLSQIATMDWDALARTAADCQACGLCAGRSRSMLSAHVVEAGSPRRRARRGCNGGGPRCLEVPSDKRVLTLRQHLGLRTLQYRFWQYCRARRKIINLCHLLLKPYF